MKPDVQIVPAVLDSTAIRQVVHAVERIDPLTVSKRALCGITYGARSGWSELPEREITCLSCSKKLPEVSK